MNRLRLRAVLVTFCGLSVVLGGAGSSCGPNQQPDVIDGYVPGEDLIAPPSVAGELDVRDFTIPAGALTRVSGDVVINAAGNVTIDGELLADDPTTPGDAGPAITIRAAGNIVVRGNITAGSGAPGESAAASKRRAGAQDEDENPAGGAGGGVELDAGGDLLIEAGAQVATGSGGGGAESPLGGAGGQGGDLKLGAGGTLKVQGLLSLGNGGDGGSPLTLGESDADVLGGSGGASGVLFVDAAEVDWPDYDPDENSLTLVGGEGGWTFEGGFGGNAALVYIESAGLTTQGAGPGRAQPRGVCGGEMCVYRAARGGDGFFWGGNGGSITVAIPDLQPGTWDGPVLKAYGGNGGNLTRRNDPRYGLSVAGRWAHAGAGGSAVVIAGNGRFGDSSDPQGGYGGTAIAYGGNGGDGSLDLLQFGGEGGAAYAQGGWGGPGLSGCTLVGDGGQGGIANAYGGNGGSAGFGGRGGDAKAEGGRGGDGGSGGPTAGRGGRGGAAVATGGDDGEYNARFPQELVATLAVAGPGEDGEDGTPDLEACD